MASGGGAGRGGRGAALLQLLNDPARKPGGAAESAGALAPRGLQSLPTPGQSGGTGDQPPPSRPSGRGALLEQMLSQQQQQPADRTDRGFVSTTPSFGAGGFISATTSAQHPTSAEPHLAQIFPAPGDAGASGTIAQVPRPMGRAALLSQQLAQLPSSSVGTLETVTSSSRVSSQSSQMYAHDVGDSRQGGLSSVHDITAALPSVSGGATACPIVPSTLSQGGAVLSTESGALRRGDNTWLERMMDRLNQEKPPVVMRGKSGQPIQLSVNYIALKCKNAGVYQYAVFYDPPVDSMIIRKKMINEHREVIGDTKAFDGALLFLPIKLRDEETYLQSIRLTDNQPVKITIRLVKVLPPASCLQLYNIIFRKVMTILKMFLLGRQHFSPSGCILVPQHRLEIWPGYVTAISEYEGGLMLNADVSHKVLRSDTVLDVMGDIKRKAGNNYQKPIYDALVGFMVIAKYNNRTYRIDDIAWDKNPTEQFVRRGVAITLVDYYKSEYGLTVTDFTQPLLVSQDKKSDRDQGRGGGKGGTFTALLIPEFSYMSGITDEMRKDFTCMKDIAVHTRVTPAQRKLSLRKFCDNVSESPEARAELAKWGLELDRDVMELEGRLLRSEKIIMGNNRQFEGKPEADWTREATSNQCISCVDVNNWILIYPQREQPKATAFKDKYAQSARDMGIRVQPPQLVQISNDRTESYLNEIRAKMTDKTQLIVMIFPSLREDRYGAIKKLLCSETPVPSQVIISRTLDERKLRSVSQKIALQINCKLGGELWGVNIPTQGLMICGVDTYHDSPSKRKNSVAAFVCTTNSACTRYYSRVHYQQPGEELVNGLKLMFTAGLRKYHEVNHKLPDRIIWFRDGVGDGQLDVVERFEVEQLLSCFHHFGDYNPNFCFIVVQKRINTRLFHRQGTGDGARFENPPPGTIMDNTVTRRDKYDFFLVSQHVRQGTVSPTHYIVLHDNSGWDPDKIQAISYKMTHMYYNWPGTVRVPAPCQYAHKLAYLVGQNIGKPHSEILSDRLFYL